MWGGFARMKMPSAWGRGGRRALLDQFVRNTSRQIFLLLNFLLFEFELTHLSSAAALRFCQLLYYFHHISASFCEVLPLMFPFLSYWMELSCSHVARDRAAAAAAHIKNAAGNMLYFFRA